MAAWLRWILGSITPPISPGLPAYHRLRRASCRRRPSGVDPRCTTKLENTHGTEFRWFGLRSLFMRRSTGRMPLFFAVILAVPMPTVGLRFQPGCSTSRPAPRCVLWPMPMPTCGADYACSVCAACAERPICIIECPAFGRIESLASKIGERSMPRQTKPRPARRRAPQQIDLFTGVPRMAIGVVVNPTTDPRSRRH